MAILFIMSSLVPLLTAAGNAAANDVGKNYFETLFKNIVSENAPWAKEDIHIANLSAKPASLTLPAGKISHQVLSPVNPNRLGRKNFSVALLVDGKLKGQVMLSGDVGIYGQVVCAGRSLQRNTILTADDLVTVRREVTMLGSGILSGPELAIGQKLTTSLQAGNIIYSHLLDSPPLVKRGDLVTIMANSNNIQVTAKGEVKRQGAKGELVAVKNLMSRREVYARVIDSGTVVVDF
jgi:flagella basal body P-ring formation protein FlgA